MLVRLYIKQRIFRPSRCEQSQLAISRRIDKLSKTTRRPVTGRHAFLKEFSAATERPQDGTDTFRHQQQVVSAAHAAYRELPKREKVRLDALAQAVSEANNRQRVEEAQNLRHLKVL